MRQLGIGVDILAKIFVIFILFGCTKSEQSSEISLKLSQNSEINYEKTELLLNISCKNDWTVALNFETTGENWCTSSKNTGSGDEIVTINIEANTWTRSRTVEIALKSGTATEELSIIQACWSDYTNVQAEKVEKMTSQPKWMELPKIEDYANSAVVSHDTYINNELVRNLTMLYDTINKIAHWVAYPISPIYIGIQSRTDNWAYDPKVPEAYQPKLTSSFPDSEYDRGHIVASATRTANYQTNAQTFYFTNMTAQQYYLNRYYVSSLEDDLRNWATEADSLYVVTGVTFSDKTTLDIGGSQIAVPDNYYYVVLRYDDEQYDSIGFWFSNEKHTVADDPFSSCAKSVEEIEGLTGFEFFVNLDDASIKSQKQVSNWTF